MTHKYFSVTLALILLSFTHFEVNACCYVRNETETLLNVLTSTNQNYQVSPTQKVELSKSDYPVVITYILQNGHYCPNSLTIGNPGCDTVSGDGIVCECIFWSNPRTDYYRIRGSIMIQSAQ